MPENQNRPLRVFLCHASDDKPAVRELYQFLRQNGIDAWLDEEKLLPGQDWRLEIPKALNASDAIIVCISKHSTTKEGYIQKEIRFALDKADEKPDGTIFVIPARLEECDLPERLSQWQWVDVFRERGREWLLRGLALRASEVSAAISGTPLPETGIPVEAPEKRSSQKLPLPRVQSHSLSDTYTIAGMEFRRIPAGKVKMGEKGEYELDIAYDYLLARFPVTNEGFKKFVNESAFKESWGVSDWEKKLDHPVVNTSWRTAQAYCKWLNQKHGSELSDGWSFCLPTETEWEKAARGTDGRLYPWGNKFEPYHCNSSEAGIKTTTPVDAYSPQGDSPYGIADMSGNVWEWTGSMWKDNPYTTKDFRANPKTPGLIVVLRGGSFSDNASAVRAVSRRGSGPDYFYVNFGFRVALAPISPNSAL